MSGRFAARFLAAALPGIPISVVASLLVVWRLSEWTEMRFNPVVVAVLSASSGMALLLTDCRRFDSRGSNGAG